MITKERVNYQKEDMMNDKKNPLGTFVLSKKRFKAKLKTSWGRWHLNTDILSLEHSVIDYGVDLRRCNSSAEILDWIIQISQKTWASNADIGNLVRALDDIFDIQGHFCGNGRDKENSGEKIAKEYIRRLAI